MDIKYYSACTSSNISVDGEYFSEMSLQRQKDVVYKALDFVIKEYSNEVPYSVLLDILDKIEPTNEMYDEEPCEQCQHYYEERSWEI